MEKKEFYKTKKEIEDWLKNFEIINYKIVEKNKKLVVDVTGDVNLSSKKLNFIPVKFNIVNGDFNCASNLLQDLEFAPVEIKGSFFCSDNKLTNLKGCPQKIGKNLICYLNKINDLNGCPKKINGTFNVSLNQLTSLNGAPIKVKDGFYCDQNKLENLLYLPEIGGSIHFDNNCLKTIKGLPEIVCGDLMLSHNMLSSLDCEVREIRGTFNCNDNKIKAFNNTLKIINGDCVISGNNFTSFKKAPDKITGSLYAYNNKIKNLLYFPQNILEEVFLDNYLVENMENKSDFTAVYEEHRRQNIAKLNGKLEKKLEIKKTKQNKLKKI